MIRKRKNKLTNGQVRRIIQLRAAIFERIRNVQMQALQTVFICFLSLPFDAFFIFDSKNRFRCHVVYNDVTRDSMLFRCAFFPLELFAFIELWTKTFNQ